MAKQRTVCRALVALLSLALCFPSYSVEDEDAPSCREMLELVGELRRLLPADLARAAEILQKLETGITSRDTVLRDARERLLELSSQLDESERRRYVASVTRKLKNRNWFDEQIIAQGLRYVSDSSGIIAVMTDIDHFKKANDTYGHAMGDKALEIVGEHLSTAFHHEFRDVDQIEVIRYGGEEFLILIRVVIAKKTGKELEESFSRLKGRVYLLCERFRDSVEHDPDLVSLGNITVSNGMVALLTPARLRSATAEQSVAFINRVIELADAALYAAKQAGRNRTVVNRIKPWQG